MVRRVRLADLREERRQEASLAGGMSAAAAGSDDGAHTAPVLATLLACGSRFSSPGHSSVASRAHPSPTVNEIEPNAPASAAVAAAEREDEKRPAVARTDGGINLKSGRHTLDRHRRRRSVRAAAAVPEHRSQEEISAEVPEESGETVDTDSDEDEEIDVLGGFDEEGDDEDENEDEEGSESEEEEVPSDDAEDDVEEEDEDEEQEDDGDRARAQDEYSSGAAKTLPSASPSSWVCPKCSKINPSHKRRCAAPCAAFPTTKPTKKRIAKARKMVPRQQRREDRPAAAAATSARADAQFWICPKCSRRNPSTKKRCRAPCAAYPSTAAVVFNGSFFVRNQLSSSRRHPLVTYEKTITSAKKKKRPLAARKGMYKDDEDDFGLTPNELELARLYEQPNSNRWRYVERRASPALRAMLRKAKPHKQIGDKFEALIPASRRGAFHAARMAFQEKKAAAVSGATLVLVSKRDRIAALRAAHDNAAAIADARGGGWVCPKCSKYNPRSKQRCPAPCCAFPTTVTAKAAAAKAAAARKRAASAEVTHDDAKIELANLYEEAHAARRRGLLSGGLPGTSMHDRLWTYVENRASPALRRLIDEGRRKPLWNERRLTAVAGYKPKSAFFEAREKRRRELLLEERSGRGLNLGKVNMDAERARAAAEGGDPVVEMARLYEEALARRREGKLGKMERSGPRAPAALVWKYVDSRASPVLRRLIGEAKQTKNWKDGNRLPAVVGWRNLTFNRARETYRQDRRDRGGEQSKVKVKTKRAPIAAEKAEVWVCPKCSRENSIQKKRCPPPCAAFPTTVPTKTRKWRESKLSPFAQMEAPFAQLKGHSADDNTQIELAKLYEEALAHRRGRNLGALVGGSKSPYTMTWMYVENRASPALKRLINDAKKTKNWLIGNKLISLVGSKPDDVFKEAREFYRQQILLEGVTSPSHRLEGHMSHPTAFFSSGKRASTPLPASEIKRFRPPTQSEGLLVKTLSRSRSVTPRITPSMLELGSRVVSAVEENWGIECSNFNLPPDDVLEELVDQLEDYHNYDGTAYGVRKFLEGDEEHSISARLHKETEKALREWLSSRSKSHKRGQRKGETSTQPADGAPSSRRRALDPLSYLSQRIAKNFSGRIYFGTVRSYDENSGRWGVLYDDGDQELFTIEGLLKAFKLRDKHGASAEAGEASNSAVQKKRQRLEGSVLTEGSRVLVEHKGTLFRATIRKGGNASVGSNDGKIHIHYDGNRPSTVNTINSSAVWGPIVDDEEYDDSEDIDEISAARSDERADFRASIQSMSDSDSDSEAGWVCQRCGKTNALGKDRCAPPCTANALDSAITPSELELARLYEEASDVSADRRNRWVYIENHASSALKSHLDRARHKPEWISGNKLRACLQGRAREAFENARELYRKGKLHSRNQHSEVGRGDVGLEAQASRGSMRRQKRTVSERQAPGESTMESSRSSGEEDRPKKRQRRNRDDGYRVGKGIGGPKSKTAEAGILVEGARVWVEHRSNLFKATILRIPANGSGGKVRKVEIHYDGNKKTTVSSVSPSAVRGLIDSLENEVDVGPVFERKSKPIKVASSSTSAKRERKMAKNQRPGGSWWTMYEELKRYRKAKGDTLVPSTYPRNQSLAYWVFTQRKLRKRLIKLGEASINQERIDLLDKLNFSWSGR